MAMSSLPGWALLGVTASVATLFATFLLPLSSHRRTDLRSLRRTLGSVDDPQTVEFGHALSTKPVDPRTVGIKQQLNFPWGAQSLEFVHIPKTGGSRIEAAGAQFGLAWGSCKFTRGGYCDAALIRRAPLLDRNKWECNLPATPAWHCPPGIGWQSENDLYNGSKTFAIVRNPYELMISEFYWYHKHFEVLDSNSSKLSSTAYMNRWIQSHMGEAKTEGISKGEQGILQHFLASVGNCKGEHCILQHLYTHDEDGKQIVDHILRFESLEDDFNSLTKDYNLPFSLDQTNVRSRSFGVDDLSDDTVELINDWAALDFSHFNYQMKNPVHVTGAKGL